MPIRDQSGQSCQPFWHGVRGRSRRFFWVHWDPSPPQVHTQRVHFQPGLHRFSNEVWLHRFSSPPFGSLFTHICFLLFFHFMSGHLILSFVCTRMGPGLSVYAHNLLQPKFQVGQVFIMRRAFISCPCALVSLSSQPHTPLSHTYTLP